MEPDPDLFSEFDPHPSTITDRDPHKSGSSTLVVVLLICKDAKINTLSGDKVIQLDGTRTGPDYLIAPNLQACRMGTLNFKEEFLHYRLLTYIKKRRKQED
jgi:hypothetical protein